MAEQAITLSDYSVSEDEVSVEFIYKKDTVISTYRIFPGVLLGFNRIKTPELPPVFPNAALFTGRVVYRINFSLEGICEIYTHAGNYIYVKGGCVTLSRERAAKPFSYPTCFYTGIEIYILEEALDANPEPLTLFGIDLKRINDRYLTDQRTLISNSSKQLSDAIAALRAAHAVSTDLARLRFHSLTVLHLLSSDDIQLVPMHLSALTAQQVNAAKSAEKALTEDLSKRLSIAEVAREIGVGETSLKNWFRAVFGKNISVYLRDHRITEAKRLLDDTALPISAIGNTVGFENQSKFTQMFKKHCGLTPSDYRKRNML